jgi:hypothetical protein
MESNKILRSDPLVTLMDQVCQVLRDYRYVYRTDQSYCDWIISYLNGYQLSKSVSNEREIVL